LHVPPALPEFSLSLDLGPVFLLMALCAARIVPILLLAPFLGGRLVPGMVKIGIALALALLVFPQVASSVALPRLGPLHVVLLFMKEIFVGVALGLSASLLFQAAEAAGRLIDVARGANMAESMVPQSGTRASPLGDLYFQLAVVLFLGLGGHRVCLGALARSYVAIPVASLPGVSGYAALAAATIDMTGELLLIAVGLAAPVLVAAVLTDLALGLVNRVAPQMNVYVLGMPAKALTGAVVVLLTLSIVAGEVSSQSGGVLRNILRVTRALSQ
jgi:flagellar biosynthetic protein FliR